MAAWSRCPRLRSILLPLLAAAVLAGCSDGGAQRDAPTARFESPDAELSWQGVLACADCDGIDTRLRLQRGNGVVAQYELVEAYLDGEGAEYFHEAGRWRRDGRILRLQATSGGERLYAIDGDRQPGRRRPTRECRGARPGPVAGRTAGFVTAGK